MLLHEKKLLRKTSEEEATDEFVEVLDAFKRNGRLMFIVKAKNEEITHNVDSTIANIIYAPAVIAFYEKNIEWI